MTPELPLQEESYLKFQPGFKRSVKMPRRKSSCNMQSFKRIQKGLQAEEISFWKLASS